MAAASDFDDPQVRNGARINGGSAEAADAGADDDIYIDEDEVDEVVFVSEEDEDDLVLDDEEDLDDLLDDDELEVVEDEDDDEEEDAELSQAEHPLPRAG